MKTSYYGRINSKPYSNYKKYGVQISQSARYWSGPKYEPLFPTWEMVRCEDKDRYEEMYRDQILSKLNPIDVYNDLGENAILLCHESIARIESGETFCHRHMVARWLEEELLAQYGINVKIEELRENNIKGFYNKGIKNNMEGRKTITEKIIEARQISLVEFGLC